MLINYSRKLLRSEDLYFYNNGKIIREPINFYSKNIFIKKVKRRINKYFGKSFDYTNLEPCIFHGTNFFLPEFVENGLITIHDLSIFRHPETHPEERVKFFNENLYKSIDIASKIITDSDFTKNELIEIFNVNPEKVSTIKLGGDTYDKKISEELALEEISKLGLKVKSFILCIATMEPRKNIDKLIKAYIRLPQKIRKKYPLVLVGSIGWKSEDTLKLMKDFQDNIYYFGYLSKRQISSMYKSSFFFIYPSIYEGFGLPVAEASYFRLPLLISNIPVFKELFPFASFFDPYDDQDISNKILEMIENLECGKSANSKNNHDEHYQLTWEDTSIKTFSMYKNII